MTQYPPAATASSRVAGESRRDAILSIIGVDGRAPSCAVAVFRDGASEFVFSGLANIAEERSPDANTLYYSGSIAKQFTALAVAQLIVSGRIALDDDINSVFPEMAHRSPPITIKTLLQHTSGVPNTAKVLPLAGYRRVSDASLAETLRMITNHPYTAFPSGTTFEYSNGGYLLLSELVARRSGGSFADYVQENILEPLGMARSGVLRGVFPKDPNRARGYVVSDGAFVLSEDLPMFGGAGAMMLTLNDLARYHRDLTVEHKVWTPDIARLMTEPAVYADGSPVIVPVPGHIFGYAAGLMLSQDWILHGGNYAGFQAVFAWLPKTSHAIALLCNRGDVQPMALAARLFAAIEPDLPPLDAPRFALPNYAGRFRSDALSTAYDIALVGEDLSVTITPPGCAPTVTETFILSGDGIFKSGPISVAFDPDHRGFVASNADVSERFRRLP